MAAALQALKNDLDEYSKERGRAAQYDCIHPINSDDSVNLHRDDDILGSILPVSMSTQDEAGLHDHDGEEGEPPAVAHHQMHNETLNWSQGTRDKEELLENLGINKAVPHLVAPEKTKKKRTKRL